MGPKIFLQTSREQIVTELIVLPRFVRAIRLMAAFVVLQSIVVFTVAGLVLQCFFEPHKALCELDQLARYMYLYDYSACGRRVANLSDTLGDVRLGDATFGLDLLPVRFERVITTPLSKLPATTRVYLQIDIVLHVVWVGLMLTVCVYAKRRGASSLNKMKLHLGICFYYSLFMMTFDVSMAIVYATHVQQSLTKGMILRYSGASIAVTLQDAEAFGGWVPLAAAAAWLRGLLPLAVNVCCLRRTAHIRRSLRRREYTKLFSTEGNTTIPEPRAPPAPPPRVYVVNVTQ